MTFYYTVLDDDPDTRFACELAVHRHLPRPLEAEAAAIDAAEDYHSAHDGWESSWPLTIALYETEDGPEIGRYFVEREHEPVFYARRVEPADA